MLPSPNPFLVSHSDWPLRKMEIEAGLIVFKATTIWLKYTYPFFFPLSFLIPAPSKYNYPLISIQPIWFLKSVPTSCCYLPLAAPTPTHLPFLQILLIFHKSSSYTRKSSQIPPSQDMNLLCRLPEHFFFLKA